MPAPSSRPHAGTWLARRLLALLVLLVPSLQAVEPRIVLPLWSGTPPGDSRADGPERRVEGRPRPFYQITGVSQPTLSLFQPPAGQINGTTILIAPGGGMQRLAWEHEGLEVAQWLTSHGISAALLKYRVPAPARTGAIDAQRALGLLRSNAPAWNLDPDAIGFAGFSAGGEVGLWLLSQPQGRLYPQTDPADALPAWPAFAAFIYPGGLLQRDGSLKEPFASGLRPGLPSSFIVHAFDDTSQESLNLALAFKRIGAPVELHLYRQGGHGFGVRATGIPTSGWRDRFTEWLGDLGHLDPPAIRSFARESLAALAASRPAPRFTDLVPAATLDQAYQAQRRLVRALASPSNRIAGFKGAAVSTNAQGSLGIDQPMAAVIFSPGRLDGSRFQSIPLHPDRPTYIETEIGFITSVDLSYEILTDEQARGVVESIVPVIELPSSFPTTGKPDPRNAIASNIGSDRYLVGAPVKSPALDPDPLRISLVRDGTILHQTTGGDAAGGQWHNLRLVLNRLTRSGYTIPAGSLILGGALGRIQPAQAGRYEASFDSLGTITFELR